MMRIVAKDCNGLLRGQGSGPPGLVLPAASLEPVRQTSTVASEDESHATDLYNSPARAQQLVEAGDLMLRMAIHADSTHGLPASKA